MHENERRVNTDNGRYGPKIDSERSQFTQESCSAPENDSSDNAYSEKLTPNIGGGRSRPANEHSENLKKH